MQADTVMLAENSEVSVGTVASRLVAVAVMNWFGGTAVGKGTVKITLPFPSVVTFIAPMKLSPSPCPDGWTAVLAKNSNVNVVLDVLLRVPSMVVLVASLKAEVNSGKFCLLLPPVSPSFQFC